LLQCLCEKNRSLSAEELSKKVFNILDHICREHANCDSNWCYDERAINDNKPYNPPSDHRLDKTKYPETYLQLKGIFDQYANVNMMAYCTHPYDTQTNEALNQVIANIAPKSVCYSSSISLYSRISLVTGCHNMGSSLFYSNLFVDLGIMMTTNIAHILKTKDINGKCVFLVFSSMKIGKANLRLKLKKWEMKQDLYFH
jgi:hypothetical protein